MNNKLKFPPGAKGRSSRVKASPRIPHPASRITHHASCLTHHASCLPHPSQSGVALVITLIMLAVITFMAVTFLVVSRNEKGSVTVQTDQTIARLAADAAFQRAQAEMLAPIMAWTNPFNYGLLVSTNYININGFNPSQLPTAPPDPLNVNYDYRVGGSTNFSSLERERNIANLFFNSRPPVFITNALAANSTEFRFFLNLNRNTNFNGNPRFEPTGFLAITNDLDKPTGATNFLVGDPQWIGGLQRPEFPHSATNLFAYRYAYLVVPAGQTLDINSIHNYAKPSAPADMSRGDRFMRNQGVLTSEINLAALLVDLNTNLWPTTLLNTHGFFPYSYNINFAGLAQPANSGSAFDDVLYLMRYRYNNSYNSVASVSRFLGTSASNSFRHDFIDGYSSGPLMTNTWWPVGLTDADDARVNLSWAGAENPNRFFTTQDLFDESKTGMGIFSRNLATTWTLSKRLLMAGATNSSYDRYTFYRLLSQLGTDSAPEPDNKMNLNYCNVDTNGYVVPNKATEYISWRPAQFFTNAAIRLLVDAGYSVGNPLGATNVLVTNYLNGVLVTNLQIPIWPTNFYTPSVHRLLQLAANMYDATTATNKAGLLYLPTVYRPIFMDTRGGKVTGRVFVSGYREVLTADTQILTSTNLSRLHDLSDPADTIPVRANDLVYNVPLVIGARKGYPNFDELAMNTQIRVTRKLQFQRPGISTNLPVNEIDQMYLLTVTNVVGVAAWNSYTNAFARKLKIWVWPDISILVTNLETHKLLNPAAAMQRFQIAVSTNILPLQWRPYDPTFPAYSFQTPLGSPATNHVFLPTNSIYRRAPLDYFQIGDPRTFERTPGATNFHVPCLELTVKARLRFALVDTDANRIVDFVNLATQDSVNLTNALAQGGNCASPYHPDSSGAAQGSFFCINRDRPGDSTPTYGILNQIDASRNMARSRPGWDTTAIAKFQSQFGYGPLNGIYPQANAFQAAPVSRDIFRYTIWKANDPLVHYTVGDLTDPVTPKTEWDQADHDPTAAKNLGRKPNSRYEPWGGSPGNTPLVGKYDWRLKDPVASAQGRSDDWDPPTNKFPNIGWVGRVHRGTPWQTVYLKSDVPDLTTWTNWTGNPVLVTNVGQFSTNVYLPSAAAFIWTPQGYVHPAVPVITFSNGVAVYDAFFTQPANDRHFLDIFSTAFDVNATRGRLSINQTNLAAWSAVLSGVSVLASSLAANGNPVLSPVIISPAGPYNSSSAPATWPAVARIVNDINNTRTNSLNGVFHRLGDVLAARTLTASSPFLNTNYVTSLNDAAFERIPQQILGLLKADETPRFVVYAYGQTLKPAPRSIVTSGPFFGLCTNYQITAEMATRTVVRFEGIQPYQSGRPSAITNLHPVIESFNVLPAD